MMTSGSIMFTYTLATTLRDVETLALQDWRKWSEDPEAILPWNTSIAVEDGMATVVIRWERDKR